MEQTTYILSDGTTVKSWDDFRLRKIERTKITPPVRQTKKVKIPGANGSTDLRPYLTATPTYDARTLTDTFVYIKGQRRWESVKTLLYHLINGNDVKIVEDRDPWYYWQGTAAVTEVSDGRDVLKLKISAEIFPYKYERFSSVEDWPWSPFDFNTGVIRDYRAITVSGTKSFTIPCLDLPVIPGFWTSDSGMSVTYGGVTGNLTQRSASQDPKTYEQFADIVLPGGDRTLTLAGTGKIDIFYRGGRL